MDEIRHYRADDTLCCVIAVKLIGNTILPQGPLGIQRGERLEFDIGGKVEKMTFEDFIAQGREMDDEEMDDLAALMGEHDLEWTDPP